MNKENITYRKICNFCNEEFDAHKRTTRYCSHKCNQRAYKQAQREKKDEKFEVTEVTKQAAVRTNILLEETLKEIRNINNSLILATKPYLTPNEVCQLLSIGRKTFDRMVNNKTFPTYRLEQRKIYVKRSDIDKLFNSNVSKTTKTFYHESNT